MRLSKYHDAYSEFSTKASDTARNLAFAGIAVIWVFRVGVEPAVLSPQLPDKLLLPMGALVFALAFDLLQYVWATVAWGTLHRWWELRIQRSDEIVQLIDQTERFKRNNEQGSQVKEAEKRLRKLKKKPNTSVAELKEAFGPGDSGDPEIAEAPAWINRVSGTFFALKLVNVAFAYVLIGRYIWIIRF